MSRVTLQTIADRAGVARSTVSMALRNHREVSTQTAQYIQKLAKEMGYVPNPMISALMTDIRDKRVMNRKINIALVFEVSNEHTLENKGSADASHRFYNGIINRAEQLGYNVDLISIKDNKLTENQLKRILQARGVYGVILGLIPKEIQDWALWDEYACGVFGSDSGQHRFHCVDNDQYDAVKTICYRLRDMGYKKVGMLLEHDKQDERFRAAAYAFAKLMSPSMQIQFYEIEHSKNLPFSEHPLIQYLPVIREQGVEALVTHSPYAGVEFLERSGIRIPQDFAYVCADVAPEDDKLAGVVQNYEAVARSVVDLVESQLHRNEKGIHGTLKFISIPVAWKDGVTCPDLSHRY